MSIKFNANEIRYIALFESMTGAMVKDCIIDDELSKVTFVVKNGDMGLAIGKGGSTVTKVKRAVDKGVEIIEYNEDPAQFIRNILSPAELKSIKVLQKEGQDKIAIVNADSSNKRNITASSIALPFCDQKSSFSPSPAEFFINRSATSRTSCISFI